MRYNDGNGDETNNGEIRAALPLSVTEHSGDGDTKLSRRIARQFRPEKIILFGSYAYGKPHNESDVDLLVIMPTRNTIDQAIRIKMAFERPFSLDLIVRTPWQIERGLKDDNWFLREIVEKGKVLYEARNCEVGAKGRSRSRQLATSDVQPV